MQGIGANADRFFEGLEIWTVNFLLRIEKRAERGVFLDDLGGAAVVDDVDDRIEGLGG